MNARRARQKKESPRDRVSSAAELIDEPIERTDVGTAMDGMTFLRSALDAVASTLVDWRELELSSAAPLDEVLAEIGVEDDLVEAAGRLLYTVGDIDYYPVDLHRAEMAERLRQKVSRGLKELLKRLGGADD